MDDLQKRIQESMQRAQDQAQAQLRNMQVDRMNHQHHLEMLSAQYRVAETNQQVANEVQGIRHTLQTQIDDNREQIRESKSTEKKLARRSWWQFGLSFGVSLISAATALAALIISLGK